MSACPRYRCGLDPEQIWAPKSCLKLALLRERIVFTPLANSRCGNFEKNGNLGICGDAQGVLKRSLRKQVAHKSATLRTLKQKVKHPKVGAT